MEKTREVEFRALLTQEIFDTMLRKATETKLDVTHVTMEDAYFCPSLVKEFKEIEMDHPGSYSLRLRREINEGVEHSSLNTKIIVNAGDHNAWREHETEVSSYENTKKIIEAIGFKSFFILKKDRYSFENQGVHVCLENIFDFQPVIEVEIMTTDNDVDIAKEHLIAYLENNGIKKEMIVPKSITNILMKQKASF